MRTSYPVRPILRSIRRWAAALSGVAVVTLVLAGVAISQLDDDQSVESRALVLVTDLEISIDELPRSIEIIWERAGIAARAIEAAGLDVDEAELRGELVEVAGVGGTPIVQVVARGDRSDQTVVMANAVAEELVAALNESGGFGSLEIFEAATPERSEEPSQLPVVPLAVFAAIASVFVCLLLIFMVLDPVHTRADLAVASSADFVEEVWIETGPPILGAARSLAERLADLDAEVRLVHSGRGENMTAPVAALVERLNARVRFAGSPRSTGAAQPDEVGDVLLIPEGTPRREVVRAEASSRRLLATVLVHQGLA